MPWTAAEAKSHTKAANTPKKQRQWAHVANAMLKKTKSEAKAIRAANAAVSGDALDDAMLESLDEGRRKKTKRDPRGRLISTETEEDDGVDVSIIGDAETDSLQMHDAVELDDAAKARVTSDGYLVASPRVARTGIQIYRGEECGVPEMDEVRVYRPESSVFDAAAVHTYTHLPVTLGHPKVLVNSKNWRDHAVGDTGDEVLRDGGTVRVPMMVRDEAAVRAIRDGRDQLSVGYTCDLDWTAGVTDDGEQYDAVQTGIRANHLAIVAAARGGSSLRVGDDQQQTEDTMQLKNVVVDGIECQMTDTAASVVQRTIQRLGDDLVKANKGVSIACEQRDEVQEQLDELTKKSGEELKAKDAQIAVLTQQVKDAQDPAKLDAAINDRLAVFTVARKIMGDSYRSDSKSIVDVRREVVNSKANLGEVTKTWGDAEFKAAFEMLAASASRSGGGTSGGAGGIADARAAFSRPHFAVADEREKAYADREKEDAEAWKTGGVQKTA